VKVNTEAVLAIYECPVRRHTSDSQHGLGLFWFLVRHIFSYIFCPSACVSIGQFTTNWTQAQLNQSVSSQSSLHLVLARNGGGGNSSGYQAPTVGQNNTATGGTSFAQHTQNPKINASAKGFGASQPAYRVSKG